MAPSQTGRDLFDKAHTSPPIALVQRKATVRLNGANALRYPGDVFEDNSAVFLNAGPASPTPLSPRKQLDPHPVRANNHVRFFIDGPSTFRAMEAAIAEADKPGDFIYMLNWWADPSLEMPSSGIALGDLLADAATKGVQIRGMYWRISGRVLGALDKILLVPELLMPWIPFDRKGIDEQNEKMVDLLNDGLAKVNVTLFDPAGETVELPTRADLKNKRIGAAIHDFRLNELDINSAFPVLSLPTITTTLGSTHQKILCVKAGGKLTAFCGGVDFNRDRKEFVRLTFAGAPLHDAHTEVQGPIAGDLLQNFVSRWTDHPDSKNLDAIAGPLIATAADINQAPLDPSIGRHIVQMGRTFGNKKLLTSDSKHPTSYAFAPQGEQSGRLLMINAIKNAKKFIYIEDQYFVNMEASQLLRQALDQNNLAHITVVLPHHAIGDMPLTVQNRRAVIQNLKADHPDRVRIFYRAPQTGNPDKDDAKNIGGFHNYVHSKLTIIDDEIAIVGSINYGRRSWSHDTECSLGIYDPSSERVLTSRFARWLRIRMWAEHLFGVAPERTPKPPGSAPSSVDRIFAELHDGVASGALWARLIQIKDEFLKANPGNRFKPRPTATPPSGKGSPPPPPVPKHPRDNGFDQAAFPEDLAQTAQVRPYDVDDDPEEIRGGGFTAAQLFFGLNDRQAFDQFVDPP